MNKNDLNAEAGELPNADTRRIVYMIRADLERVVEIESCYGFKCDQWEREDFIESLRARNCIGKVLLSDVSDKKDRLNSIMGFAIYTLVRHRISILRLKVDPVHRRKGCGRMLIGNLKEKLSPGRRPQLTVDVHERNFQGIRFLQRQQFKARALLRSHYDDGSDSYAMSHDLNQFANARPSVNRLGVRRG